MYSIFGVRPAQHDRAKTVAVGKQRRRENMRSGKFVKMKTCGDENMWEWNMRKWKHAWMAACRNEYEWKFPHVLIFTCFILACFLVSIVLLFPLFYRLHCFVVSSFHCFLVSMVFSFPLICRFHCFLVSMVFSFPMVFSSPLFFVSVGFHCNIFSKQIQFCFACLHGAVGTGCRDCSWCSAMLRHVHTRSQRTGATMQFNVFVALFVWTCRNAQIRCGTPASHEWNWQQGHQHAPQRRTPKIVFFKKVDVTNLRSFF